MPGVLNPGDQSGGGGGGGDAIDWRVVTGLATDVVVYLSWRDGVVYGRVESAESSDPGLYLPEGWQPERLDWNGSAWDGMNTILRGVGVSTDGGALQADGGAGSLGNFVCSFSYLQTTRPAILPGVAL